MAKLKEKKTVKKKEAPEKDKPVKAVKEKPEEVVAEKDEEQREELPEETEEQAPEEKLKAELEEAKDKYLRLYSEFENFRRRNAKERINLIKTASSDLIVELLPIIDDFERAQAANEKQDDIEAIREGFSIIHHKLLKSLETKGLKAMEIPKGTDFDADLHEAVTRFPVEEDELKGKIIDTVEKGYYLDEKVIRFAKVVIGT